MLDRDPGFMQVLSKRLDALGCEYRPLSAPLNTDALVTMRLNALVLDLAVLGPGGLGATWSRCAPGCPAWR